MVGIAGGVPHPTSSNDHVRLGDIVVSGEHGVKQYDLVKETQTRLQHRDPPRPPSASVLEAVRFLESEMLARELTSLVDHIERGLTALDCKRPAPKYDVLTDSKDPAVKVKHPKDDSRRMGKPRVFVGPIASANVLLKNPKKRDMLRNKYGVKAVEMEGSGIADASWNLEVGYIVIRGICDYCDSNKGDRWQCYAAIAAAAYASILLQSISADAIF
jgi:nucleoside phosphorylase